MSRDLFRAEVMAARRGGLPGGISLAQPPAHRLLALVACATALLIACFLASASYTRRSAVAGRLVPVLGLANVIAPTSGVVQAVHSTEGTRVAMGEALAVIAVPRATIAGGPAASELASSLDQRHAALLAAQRGQQDTFTAQATGLQAQLVTAREELAGIQAQIQTREERLRIDEQTLARLRHLHQRQYASAAQLEQQQSTVLEQQATMQELHRQATALKRGMQQLEQSLRELPGQRQARDSDLQRELAVLAQERVELQASGAVSIPAPVAGLVATQLVKAGQSVQQGQPLLAVLPGDGQLQAELFVPSRAAGFIAPGDRVLLRYQAFPHQKFGHQQGFVAAVGRSALEPGELGASIAQRGGEPLYRVTVELARQSITAYGRAEMLKPGMLLDADILGERRRLVEWLFEPLYSLRGRLGGS